MQRAIYLYGSGVLRRVAEDISADYAGLNSLILDMWETMRTSDGVGLAAPQIGLPIRLFVIDGSPFSREDPSLSTFQRVFINAHIVEYAAETSLFSEGCLSLPGIHENVPRPVWIRMKWVDEHFTAHEEVFSGIAARIIQHEYDHLDGKLFIDHISALRKRMLQSRLKRIARGRAEADYPCLVG